MGIARKLADLLSATGDVKVDHLDNIDVSTKADTTYVDTQLSDKVGKNESSIILPTGTNAQRPTSPNAGNFRYTTDDSGLEYYDGTDWRLVEGASADPHWDNVVFYVNGDELVDKSGRHVLTPQGSGGLSSSVSSPVGSSLVIGLQQGNSSGNYITVANNLIDFRMDDLDWTFEYWLYVPGSGNGSYYHTLSAESQNGRGTFKGYSNTPTAYFYSGAGGSGPSYQGTAMPFNTWVHMCWEKTGNVFRLYVDGVSRSAHTGYSFQGGTPPHVYMGNNSTHTNEAYLHYVDNVRWTRGVARYQGNSFTPPTTQYPAR